MRKLDSRLLVYIVLFGFGVALGPLASLWSPIVLARFGHENATATVGLLNIATGGVAFFAPLAISVLHSVTGGYVIPFTILGTVTALGAVLFRWGTSSKGSELCQESESLSTEPTD